MTARRPLRVRVCFTAEVDAVAWAGRFGLDPADTSVLRGDIRARLTPALGTDPGEDGEAVGLAVVTNASVDR